MFIFSVVEVVWVVVGRLCDAGLLHPAVHHLLAAAPEHHHHAGLGPLLTVGPGVPWADGHLSPKGHGHQ